MSGKLGFRKGELARLIAEFGLTLEDFSRLAAVDGGTLRRALDGKPLQVKTWGKITKALGEAGKAA